MPQEKPPTSGLANRLTSLDVYRGFVMFLMMAEILHLSQVAKSFPEDSFWHKLAYHQTHVDWAGCSLHDLIQPSFSFLVGAALPFSIFSRRQKGQSFLWMLLHAIWRSALLVGLGVFLRSTHTAQTRFTFEDTLSQIGLGYLFLFLLGCCRQWVQWVALGVILIGYWGAFALYQAPERGPDFDYDAIGVTQDFVEKNPPYTGLASHWNKNANLAFAFDDKYVRQIPEILGHGEPYKPNRGGYATLSFIPTLGTMILGLLAGGWLRGEWATSKKIAVLVACGAVSLAVGLLLDYYGICPSVKRIWTPAWVLVSGGWCMFFTAGFYFLVDACGLRQVFFPLTVIGMNSIAIYFLVHIELHGFIQRSFRTHFSDKVFAVAGEPLQAFVAGAIALAVDWLILYWMYRNKVFVRI
jgi:predicted acyltransferase